MMAHEGVEVYLRSFLTSALDRGEWSASRPGRFTSDGEAPGTLRIGGSEGVGPRADLDVLERRNRRVSSRVAEYCLLKKSAAACG
jgi:hypothetical protein